MSITPIIKITVFDSLGDRFKLGASGSDNAELFLRGNNVRTTERLARKRPELITHQEV